MLARGGVLRARGAREFASSEARLVPRPTMTTLPCYLRASHWNIALCASLSEMLEWANVAARLQLSRDSTAAAGEAGHSQGLALAGPGGGGRAAVPAHGSARAPASPGGGAGAALARLPAEPAHAPAVLDVAGCQPLLPPPVQPESAPASLGGGAAGPPPPPGCDSGGPGSTSAGALAMRAVPRPQPKVGRLDPPLRPAAGAAGGAVAADFMRGCAFGGLRPGGASRQRRARTTCHPKCLDVKHAWTWLLFTEYPHARPHKL